jgi:hypothetical protein
MPEAAVNQSRSSIVTGCLAATHRFCANAGIDLPPELLRHTYVSDPYESVRLLA